MKITFMTLQKASIVCLGVGMFLALGSAGTFETTGEIQTGVYVAAFVFLLAAGLLMRLSFALQDYEEKQRKIHKAQVDALRLLGALGNIGGSENDD